MSALPTGERRQKIGCLRLKAEEAENDAVRTRIGLAAILMVVLTISLCGNSQAPPKTHAMPPPQERVDINHATAVELLKVPGMTQSWAGRIVRFRPYRTKQDLLDRGVVPSEVYDRIKDYVIAHRDKQ